MTTDIEMAWIEYWSVHDYPAAKRRSALKKLARASLGPPADDIGLTRSAVSKAVDGMTMGQLWRSVLYPEATANRISDGATVPLAHETEVNVRDFVSNAIDSTANWKVTVSDDNAYRIAVHTLNALSASEIHEEALRKAFVNVGAAGIGPLAIAIQKFSKDTGVPIGTVKPLSLEGQNILSAAIDAYKTIVTDPAYTPTTTAADTTTDTTKGSSMTSVAINPTFSEAINALLKSATGGTYSDINVLVDEIQSKAAALSTATEEVTRLRSALASAPAAAPVSVAPTHGGAAPTGNVVMKRAKEIFKGPGGKMSNYLDFDVPMIEWDAPNPYVPAIDPDYQFRPMMIASYLDAVYRGSEAVWLDGHTGTGKSTFVEQVHARLGHPVIRVNFDSEITRMDLVGRDVISTDAHGHTSSHFEPGILVRALEMPCVLLCDEMDFIRPDVAYVLQRCLEMKGLLLNEDGGRFIAPHPMFRIVATANTKGQGDEYGCYSGARVQSSAFLDRFTTFLTIEYMKPEDEKALIMAKVPSLNAGLADKISQMFLELRTSFLKGQTLLPVSPRVSIAFASKMARTVHLFKSEKDCVNHTLAVTVLGKATQQDIQKVKEIAQRVWS